MQKDKRLKELIVYLRLKSTIQPCFFLSFYGEKHYIIFIFKINFTSQETVLL